jgi:hypothetical protein
MLKWKQMKEIHVLDRAPLERPGFTLSTCGLTSKTPLKYQAPSRQIISRSPLFIQCANSLTFRYQEMIMREFVLVYVKSATHGGRAV